jgi:L-asparaginase/Glu-tRNA(Gln) amidotransferase subunit D
LDTNHIKSFSDLFGRLDEDGKIIVITTQSPHGSVQLGHYAAGAIPGAISGYNMPPDTAAAKISFGQAIGLDQHSTKELIQTPLSGDFDPKYARLALKAA